MFKYVLFFLLISGFVFGQAIPRSYIDSDSFFKDSDTNTDVYSQPSQAPEEKVQTLAPFVRDEERTKHMNEKFNKYVEENDVKDIYVMFGMNEYTPDIDNNILDGLSMGVRMNYETILEKYLNIEAKHFYPYFTAGSKGFAISPMSYAFIDTEVYKIYIDPIIPYINAREGEFSMASGLSAGYYHDKYSSWGIEGVIKYLWMNSYKEYDYKQKHTTLGMETDEVERTKISKSHRLFWGVYLVYRF